MATRKRAARERQLMGRTYRSSTRSHTYQRNGKTYERRGHVRQRPVHHPQPARAGRNAVRAYKRARRGHWGIATMVLGAAVFELGGWGAVRLVVGVGFVVAVAVALGIYAHRECKAKRSTHGAA